MENLFKVAMTDEKCQEIHTIKKNKAFALRLQQDLDRVFYTYPQTDDYTNKSVTLMKKEASHCYHRPFLFQASAEGVYFKADLLISAKRIKPLFDKYKDSVGTKSEKPMTPDFFGYVEIRIELNDMDEDLKDKLRDIVALMEMEPFRKRF